MVGGRSPEVEQARRAVELQGEEILRRKEQLVSARSRGEELEAKCAAMEERLSESAEAESAAVAEAAQAAERELRSRHARDWRRSSRYVFPTK